jgi:glycosyltransferase involved in cell wall biosynthesis
LLIDFIKEINSEGGQINNLGEVPFAEAIAHTSQSKFVIFPSLKETFGLGLVEATLLNCYVLASDLPYVFESIKPTLVFNPLSEEEMVSSIISALNTENQLTPSQLLVENEIEKLIKLVI